MRCRSRRLWNGSGGKKRLHIANCRSHFCNLQFAIVRFYQTDFLLPNPTARHSTAIAAWR